MSKYFLYAIGEIFLVVIGILLALQINSWNQVRIEAIKEKEYYKRFLDDIKLDEELIAEQIIATEDRLLGANILIKALQKGDGNMEAIASGLGKAVSRSDFGLKPTQTTFDDIKSSGNIQLIKDLEIRKKLDDYYAFMSGLMTTINGNASGLGPRMYLKEKVIGTGLFQLAKKQNAFDPSYVNTVELEKLSQLTQEHRMELTNDAVFYAAMTSRNLQHFEVLKKKVGEMKIILIKKCNQ